MAGPAEPRRLAAFAVGSKDGADLANCGGALPYVVLFSKIGGAPLGFALPVIPAHGFPVGSVGILLVDVAAPPAEGGPGFALPPAEGGAVVCGRYFSGMEDHGAPGILKDNPRLTDERPLETATREASLELLRRCGKRIELYLPICLVTTPPYLLLCLCVCMSDGLLLDRFETLDPNVVSLSLSATAAG